MDSVQHILPAAAPVGEALIQQFKQRFPGITVREGMCRFLWGNFVLLKTTLHLYDDSDEFNILLNWMHLFPGWGMSELSPLGLLNPLDEPRDGSCGLAVPNTTFKVVDVSTGNNLEARKEGEICCKGPMVNTKLNIKRLKPFRWYYSVSITWFG